MKPARLAKALALSFVLGAILSVGSDRNITRQVQAIALSQAQAIATSVMQSLGDWLELGLDAALKGIMEQSKQSGATLVVPVNIH